MKAVAAGSPVTGNRRGLGAKGEISLFGNLIEA